MPTGTVKKFVAEKGFGFIGPDDGSADIFAPARTLEGDKTAVREGLKVTYEYKQDDRTGKPMAASWKVLDDGGLGAASMSAGGYSAYGMPAYGAYGVGGALPHYSPYGAVAPTTQPYAIQAPPGGLPPGWESAMDPTSGNAYYFNRATGETTW
eukprot:CAMPEP_0169130352 /NCGR_PEP_ID=MMETSP1015-20121227/37650_1 /TAXON_ID=342587 /ORGANISM="Karlodinium micrum, Strain CCMP2283" /LENGTH=152 /DNA_ID=CAMNT_0009194505 /DNA_START=93 /DNA_END=548 /DNA_ORIENTATION=-